MELQVPIGECNSANLPLGLEAAHDARVLMDNLAAIGRQIGVVLDTARVGAAGHSNGGNVIWHLAGAKFPLAVALPDNRFSAFLANAPPGTTNSVGTPSGFTSTSWAGITKPVMVQASDGDAPAVRREAYDLMPRGEKYLAFFSTTAVDHGSLALLPDAFKQLIGTNGVAFFDAYVRGRAEAKEWLTTNQLARATKGVGQMNTK